MVQPSGVFVVGTGRCCHHKGKDSVSLLANGGQVVPPVTDHLVDVHVRPVDLLLGLNQQLQSQ